MAKSGTFLKWAGGKGKMIPTLDGLFPPTFGNYFEPFIGAGAVFFYLATSGRLQGSARLSDLNGNLINAFVKVRDCAEELIEELLRLRLSHNEKQYYRARDRYNSDELDPLLRAAHLIYLNKTGYNGLYRVNQRGVYNVPCGRYVAPKVVDPPQLRRASELLQCATLEMMDFEAAVAPAAAADLVYFDPPYDPLSRTASFTSYAGLGFGEADQIRLARTFEELDNRGVYVVLSNHHTPLVRKLYRNYRIDVVNVGRGINSNAARRATPVAEAVVVGRTLDRLLTVSPDSRALRTSRT